MQNFCTFLFDLYEIQTDTDVVYLPSGVNNDSYDWCVQYKQRLFGLCLCSMCRRKWLVILPFPYSFFSLKNRIFETYPTTKSANFQIKIKI